jgi:hypothetical protein
MNVSFFSMAWQDVKSSPRWFATALKLALVQMIPVFGSMVSEGYIYGWAREAAWNIHKPMPTAVFHNEDGTLYKRGAFIWVYALVLGLITVVLSELGSVIMGSGDNAALAAIGLLISLATFALGIFLQLFVWTGSMRIALYNTLGSGFQLNRLWNMIKRESSGIIRILITYFLVSLAVGFIMGILLMPIVIGVIAAGVGSVDVLATADEFAIFGTILGAGAMATILLIVWAFVLMVATVILELVSVRAIGYWTSQFDVAMWGAEQAPMPFETGAPLGQTYSAAYQQYQQPVQTYQQPTAQPSYQTPMAQQNPQAQPVQQQYQAPVAQPQVVEQPAADQPYQPAPAEPPVQPLEPVAQQAVQSLDGAADPVQPVAPAEPTEPVQPVAPAEPAQPAEPEAPAPAEPAQPAAPEQPADAVDDADQR